MNFYEKEDFSRTVYSIQGGIVVPATLETLCREWAETTTTPGGVDTCFHVRGNDLWSWGPAGNGRHHVASFDTEADAYHALLLSFRYDLLSRADAPEIFDTEEDAISALQDLSGE